MANIHINMKEYKGFLFLKFFLHIMSFLLASYEIHLLFSSAFMHVQILQKFFPLYFSVLKIFICFLFVQFPLLFEIPISDHLLKLYFKFLSMFIIAVLTFLATNFNIWAISAYGSSN